MDRKLPALPIGIQTFEILRRQGCLYVDKTAKLLELANTAGRYFLSRPRRFGKSLTLSTLDAMFSGKAELFRGLAAEEWVREQAEHPAPVLRLDMAHYLTEDRKSFENSLYINLK
nr:AAA family ATPase [Fretibacterium sp.]